ncbi:hypothetical protein HB790_08455 [Listeria welshimeri]|uniref:hypothetical protein n=1 Tax=Listeria welshimeri TaxID=1643 RepID=UPI0013917672|nr:hypothetical protein [Listeria welshimeri]MBC1320283.1 hypothetical protein [Listeria welshimeri]MBC1452173.1 hypothetical protein [Listeria welshimeri]MBC1454629.1 hypothetical protein [Listeria welshimeri]MBC1640784.1 hypothetical protein [Listeria welshimeri]MBC1698841.1 hypothetical protein [Listeria welshimeri]
MFSARRSDGYEGGDVFSLGTVYRIEIDTTYLNIAELLAKHLNQAKNFYSKSYQIVYSKMKSWSVWTSFETKYYKWLGSLPNEYEGQLDGKRWIKKQISSLLVSVLT